MFSFKHLRISHYENYRRWVRRAVKASLPSRAEGSAKHPARAQPAGGDVCLLLPLPSLQAWLSDQLPTVAVFLLWVAFCVGS